MLSIVATPIGNLGDITVRALECLRSADLIAAEDTRHARKLLEHYQITTALLSYHQHNEAQRTAQLLPRLQRGETIALISDAGMPTLSDPGLRLLQAVQREQLDYTIIPGPSAITTALAGSGFSPHPFYFGGFLPPKSGGRQRELEAACQRVFTSLYFESPHRLLRTLEALSQIDPSRPICIARELTKKFEEYLRSSPAELLTHFKKQERIRGEITLIISGTKEKNSPPPPAKSMS